MSEADKMFEEMGYKMYQDGNFFWYRKKITENIIKDITISLDRQEVACETEYFNKAENLLNRTGNFTFKELQAISKKVEESLRV